ncbi:MAG: T9SS type A sorting domain-containing protein [Bacteroidetes bacterium]|nr:T9SS type A sorting domain-containing protein [Bacteroidota bacterium]
MKKTLKNLVIGATLLGASILPSFGNAQSNNPQSPEYGLNMYVPAHNSLYQTDTDWYGSGDVNNDGVIDMQDYNSTITGNDPFNDGTYRGDTDLDGQSGTPADKQIILNYINGDINHINKWEFETEEQKIAHLEKALAIDPTDQINPNTSGWICNQYVIQNFINFSGVYDVENSPFAEDNGTNLQYDLSHNGIFRIRSNRVSTNSYSGAHAINSVYLGSPENQDATNFEKNLFFEPQTDEFYEVGDWGLNDFAHENWYGYYFNVPFQEWKYGSVPIVNYDLSGGNPSITYQNPDLVISWTPFDGVQFPADQEHEFYLGILDDINPGEPDSLYNGTSLEHTVLSNQTNNGSCSDVTFTQEHTWELTAGAYNPSNTSAATHVQYINVHDQTPPEFEVDENGPYNIWDNSGLEVTFEEDSTSTQGTNPNNANFYNYLITESYTGKDVCDNEDTKDFITEVQDLEGPLVTSYPITNNDTIIAPEGVSIHPDSLELYGVPAWATWEDPQNSPIINKTFEDSLTYEDGIKKIWFREQFAEDVSGNPSQNIVEHYVLEPKTTSVKESKNLEDLVGNVYPNPTNGNLKVKYTLSKNSKVAVEIYDLSGRLIDNFSEEQFSGVNILTFKLDHKNKGFFIIKVFLDDNQYSTQKLLIH